MSLFVEWKQCNDEDSEEDIDDDVDLGIYSDLVVTRKNGRLM